MTYSIGSQRDAARSAAVTAVTMSKASNTPATCSRTQRPRRLLRNSRMRINTDEDLPFVLRDVSYDKIN